MGAKAKLKAYERAKELIGWRMLAGEAIRRAEVSGCDARCISYLREWQDELTQARTPEQWEELNEKLGF